MLFFNTYCFETNFNHVFVVLFIPRHTIVVEYYGFTLGVRVSVGPLSVHPWGVVWWCEGAVYLTSPGRPTDIGLQLGKACYPCSG